MRAFAVLAFSILLTAPAAAQPSDGERSTSRGEAATSNSASESGGGEERRICRRVETNTGSRVPFRRLCLTERQWEAYRRQN